MSVAYSYARAMYEVAQERGFSKDQILQVELEMDRFVDLISQSKEARVALTGPITSSKEKALLIEEITKKLQCSDPLRSFLELLARKQRLSLIEEIRDAFGAVRVAAEGGVMGRLTSAESVSESDVDTLAKAFSQKLGKKVAFRVFTDPSLLAGIQVTVNGVTYDGTLRSQLQKLRDSFVAGLPGAHV